jgi:hypothetical protein
MLAFLAILVTAAVLLTAAFVLMTVVTGVWWHLDMRSKVSNIFDFLSPEEANELADNLEKEDREQCLAEGREYIPLDEWAATHTTVLPPLPGPPSLCVLFFAGAFAVLALVLAGGALTFALVKLAT